MASLLRVLYAVALCAMLSMLLAVFACMLGSLSALTRGAVTTRLMGRMTLWGTVATFGAVLLYRLAAG